MSFASCTCQPSCRFFSHFRCREHPVAAAPAAADAPATDANNVVIVAAAVVAALAAVVVNLYVCITSGVILRIPSSEDSE